MNTNTTMKLTAVLVALAGAGAAYGQGARAEANEKKIQGRLDQPLERGAVGLGGAASTMTLISTNGDNSYRVDIKDGVTTATVNGKEVPSDRVRRDGKKIELLDAAGDVLATFDVPAVHNAWGAGGGATAPRVMRFQGTPEGGLGNMWMQPPVGEKMELPKVMIGIRMTDDTGVVIVDEAVEGLPAEKAGVMAGDVLLSIDGQEIKKVTDVREAVKEHAAGDMLEVKVRRDDKERTLAVKLEAYDSEKLPMIEQPEVRVEGFPGMGHRPADWRDDVRKHIEEAMSQLKNSDALSSDKLKMHLDKALGEALASLDKAKDETSMWLRQYAPEGQGNARAFVFGGDNPDHVFAVPGHADSTKQLEKVSDQLDRLSRRLDEIQKRLDAMDKPR